MGYGYTPNERIVDRAVEIWKRLLREPKFDNGDKSFTGLMGQTFAGMVNDKTNNSTDEILDKFGVELKVLLMSEVTLEELQGKPPAEKPFPYYHNSLGVDYGPDWILSAAAQRAGLTTQFPWKTNMSISENYVCLGSGYAAPWVYHYPLKDGRWLLAKLSGEDVAKVIEYVEGGSPVFEIEETVVEEPVQ